jgi:hypothetical protein
MRSQTMMVRLKSSAKSTKSTAGHYVVGQIKSLTRCSEAIGVTRARRVFAW